MKGKSTAAKNGRKENVKARQPSIKIPLSFEKAVDGLLGLSPEDAKSVRESVKKPEKKKKR